MRLKGYLLVMAAATMWGLLGPVSKKVFEGGVGPLETAFWRAALSWVMFAAHAAYERKFKIKKQDAMPLFIFGFLCVSVFFASYQLAIKSCGAAVASVLLYTAPAWVAFLSFMILKEQMTKMKLIALAMTLAGVAGVSLGPSLSQDHTLTLTFMGIMMGLTAGLTYALYYIFGKLYLDRYTTPTLFLYALPIGALGLTPFFNFHPDKSATVWICLAVLAAVSTYGAYSVYYAGLKRLEATNAAVVATLEPVIAAVLAYFWWNETFSPLGYVGSVLILGAVLVIVLDGKNRRKAHVQAD